MRGEVPPCCCLLFRETASLVVDDYILKSVKQTHDTNVLIKEGPQIFCLMIFRVFQNAFL